MRAMLLVPYYFSWHYSRGVKGVAIITGNLAWFVWHFFSVGVLLQTFFSPWQRLHEGAGRFDVAGMFSAFIVNSIMRIVGIIIRSVFILLGLTGIGVVVMVGTVMFFLWLCLPVAVVTLVALGIHLLIRPL